ncbi:MAG: hypothetical protein DDT27_01179 [Dehalococcoidia bacterium]|nr:hypothetical protein [Chloroflexota bacterium]MBT9160743.1 hypothetical protein [Chloroflexota bacterium]MBT9162620.1 hypothetical protein [Chloroflexota bacterium]
MGKVFIIPVVIEPCEEGGYFANCSVLQGCHAEGENCCEVLENIQDVIRVHIEARLEHGETIPAMTYEKGIALSINLPVETAR